MTPVPDDLWAALLQALDARLEHQEWRDLDLETLARDTGFPPETFHHFFPDKAAVLEESLRRAGEESQTPEDQETRRLPPRDRIFAHIMSRLDRMAPFRRLVAEVIFPGGCPPCDIHRLARPWLASLARLCRQAGLETGGIRGTGRVLAVAGVWSITLYTWVRDTTPDLAPTMVALDQALDRFNVCLEDA